MTLENEISALLQEAESLFSEAGLERWAVAMRRAQAELDQDAVRGAALLRGMFGGMGSLNDIVLQRDGALLIDENTRLNKIRERLYSLSGEVN